MNPLFYFRHSQIDIQQNYGKVLKKFVTLNLLMKKLKIMETHPLFTFKNHVSEQVLRRYL